MPTSAASESFRTLRTALTLTHPDARQIVVTSAEPGDGKTTTLANLAVCYAQAEQANAVDRRRLAAAGLDGLMNMRGPQGLSEVLRSEVDISQMAAAHIRRLGRGGAGHSAFRSAADRSGRIARRSAVLAIAGLGGNRLRPDPHRQPAHAGHHRHGDHRPVGRRRDPGRAAGQEPPPPGDARGGTARTDEDPVLGLVVNRTGSEDEHGYYGYHGYGYGYGYGYGVRIRRGRLRTTDATKCGVDRRTSTAADDECRCWSPASDTSVTRRDEEDEPRTPCSSPDAWHEEQRGEPETTIDQRHDPDRSIGGSISTCSRPRRSCRCSAGIYYLSFWLRFEGQLGDPNCACFRATVGWVADVKLAWFVGLAGVSGLAPLGHVLRPDGSAAGGHRRPADDGDDPVSLLVRCRPVRAACSCSTGARRSSSSAAPAR